MTSGHYPGTEPDPDRFAARRAAFKALHREGCFTLPNPMNTGTARYLAYLGFPALATTSSGAAFSRGRPDGGLSLDQVLANVAEIVEATGLPVSADFEDGHAADLDGLAANVARCVGLGVAGLSIEDATGDRSAPLYDLPQAVERLRAARAAIDATGAEVVLVGRAECFLAGHENPLAESIRRLTAYAEAGADCLYAPGVRTAEQVSTIVKAVAPMPVNVLALPQAMGRPAGLSIPELAELGVRRVSVGGALAQAAWGGFIRAATALKAGRLAGFSDNAGYAELSMVFGETPAPPPPEIKPPAAGRWPR